MLNKEKYADKIIELAEEGSFIAVNRNGEVCDCEDISDCINCLFGAHNACDANRKKWFNAEYEPPVDWGKVKVDTKIMVRSYPDSLWLKRHFAEYKDGCVYAFDSGKTSWTNKDTPVSWRYAKLAEEN